MPRDTIFTNMSMWHKYKNKWQTQNMTPGLKIHAFLPQNTIKFTHQKVKCTSLSQWLSYLVSRPKRTTLEEWASQPHSGPDQNENDVGFVLPHQPGARGDRIQVWSPEGAPGTAEGWRGGNTQKHTAPPLVSQSYLDTRPNAPTLKIWPTYRKECLRPIPTL